MIRISNLTKRYEQKASAFAIDDGHRAVQLREGFYRRTLTIDTGKDPNNSVTVSGRIENPGKRFRVYVGVDGIDAGAGGADDIPTVRGHRHAQQVRFVDSDFHQIH